MYCPECGEEIDDDSRYCQACGAELAGAEEEKGTADTEREHEGAAESESESEGASGIRRGVYWIARLGQIVLVAVAVILILGAIAGNMNVIAFAAIGIFTLVLFAGVGAVELLLIRPLS